MPTNNIFGYECKLDCCSAMEVYKSFCADKQNTEICNHCENAVFKDGIYTCKILMKDMELRGES